MVDHLIAHGDPPSLHRPVLVAAFSGWNDAGESATGAVDALAEHLGATVFAELDPDVFCDFQVSRPSVHFDAEGNRQIDWPSTTLSWARIGGTGAARRGVVFVQGAEPNLRWRAFADAIVHAARRTGVELAVTVGALQVDVPHTRPVPVTGAATDPELAGALELRASTYEGPTGITGVVGQACAAAGLPGISLWAGVPHYLGGAAYAPATLALVERLGRLLGTEIDVDDLARDAVEQRDEIDELVRADDELSNYVAELEERVDDLPDDAEMAARVVSGDELAAAFERYLRGDGPS